jgi:diketogulonate reductase-like aldo/keto reductase
MSSSSSSSTSSELNTGVQLPLIGLGTWKSSKGDVGKAVTYALEEAGYRHIDCASVYGNEAEIGEALADVFKRGKVRREDVFLTSKVFNHFHGDVEKVSLSVDRTLSDLGVGYVDLLLIHWPLEFVDAVEPLPTPMRHDDGYPNAGLTVRVEFLETWRSFEKLVAAGKARAIGVSNFTAAQLKELIAATDTVPAVNQVEFHPFLVQSELAEFCKQQGIVLEAYSPLGSPDSYAGKLSGAPSLLRHELINSIADKHGKSPAQVLIRWSTQKGSAVLPKSCTPSRILQNISIFDFALADDDIASIDALSTGHRFGFGWLPGHFLPPRD